MVGVFASLTYVAFALGAVEVGLIHNRPLAVTLGIACGYCVSYFGHHSFTYRRRARHGKYLPRYIGAQAAICILMVGLVFGLTAIGIQYWLANAVVVIAWPLTNLAASELWVFYEEADNFHPGQD